MELFEPCAAGRIANSSDLFVGLYFHMFITWNDGLSWSFWELAIGERGQLEVKDKKENMPLVDSVAIVAEVYSAVYQLHFTLWNTTRVT